MQNDKGKFHIAGNFDTKTLCGITFKWECKDKRYNHWDYNHKINRVQTSYAASCKKCIKIRLNTGYEEVAPNGY